MSKRLAAHGTEPLRRLIDLAEAADYLGVSTRTVRRWIEDGKIRGFTVGHGIRLDLADVMTMARPMPTIGGAGDAA